MSETLPPPIPLIFQPASEPQKTSGMAIAALILGILSLLCTAIFIVPTVLAIVFGHISFARINRDSKLRGRGMAMAGFILGYLSIPATIVLGLLAAMAIPAFEKVRENSLRKAMQNDARQIAAAAQQVMVETGEKSVSFHIDPSTGAVTGAISSYVHQVTKGTTEVDGILESSDGSFSLRNPHVLHGAEVIFDSEGKQK